MNLSFGGTSEVIGEAGIRRVTNMSKSFAA